jgi:hypothetical protein
LLSAGDGSKGQRWYAWAWIATTSPRHHLLVRRHLRTGDPGLPLLLGTRRAAPDQGPADPRRWAQMAGRRFRVQQGLLRPRPVPGPALHRDRPPRCAGDGRPGHLRHHRRASRTAPTPRHRPRPGRPAATAGTWHDPADHPGDQATARRPHHPRPFPVARHPLGRMDPPPPERARTGRWRSPQPTDRSGGSTEWR